MSNLVFETSTYIRISYNPSSTGNLTEIFELPVLTVINRGVPTLISIVESSTGQSTPVVRRRDSPGVCQDTAAGTIICLLPVGVSPGNLCCAGRATKLSSPRTAWICVRVSVAAPHRSTSGHDIHSRSIVINAL